MGGRTVLPKLVVALARSWLPRRLRRLARENGVAQDGSYPSRTVIPIGSGYEGTWAALGPRSILISRTTTVTSGHPTRRPARPLAGRSIARSSLTTTRSQVRALSRPPDPG
jgi:hypothetical protein